MSCSYCNQSDEKLTREHIIPDGFLRGMNRKAMTTWSDKAPVRVIKGDMVIKDVCAKCNNELLSILDNYALNAITKYNGEINRATKKIFFKYDFEKISRWLLKVVYNSARASGSVYDSSIYKQCTEYILEGGTCELDFSIYAQFIDISPNELKDSVIYHYEKNHEYSIDHFRIAPFKLKDISTYYCALRVIMVNSFAFFVIVYDKDVKKEEITGIEECFEKIYPQSEKLLRGSKKTKLTKEKNFWKHSLLTNMYLRDNFMEKREVSKIHKLNIITLNKKELQTKDFYQIKHFIGSKRKTKDGVLDYYQKFEIAVDGYNEDSRELWEVKEFREYIRELIDQFPSIIWFLNLNVGFFRALVYAYITNDNLKEAEEEKTEQLMMKCFQGINEMTNLFAMDHSYNIKITELFTDSLFNIIGYNNQ